VLETLISNKTRLKLLVKFFLTPGNTGYLRELEEEFDASTNAIRLELNRFEEAGLLVSGMEKNRKVFSANQAHPLHHDICSIVRKYLGIDQVVDKVVNKLGDVSGAWITGEMAQGLDARVIELVIAGNNIDQAYLTRCIGTTENLIKRTIHCRIINETEIEKFLTTKNTPFQIYRNLKC
jgi:hypothetical protein